MAHLTTATAPLVAGIGFSSMRTLPLRFLLCVALSVACSKSSGNKASSAGDTNGVPHIVVADGSLLLDGVVVTSLAALADSHRVGPIEAERTALRAVRDRWKAQHPRGEPFPGRILIEAPGGTRLRLFKSLLQTAAFAGFPLATLRIVGLGTPVASRQADVEMPVPGPPPTAGIAAPEPPRLAVVVRPGAVTLRWTLAKGPPNERTVADPAKLCPSVEEMSARDGGHRIPSDRALDQAVVYALDDGVVGDVAPVLEALGACRRDIEGVDRVRDSRPRLVLTLAIAEAPPAADEAK